MTNGEVPVFGRWPRYFELSDRLRIIRLRFISILAFGRSSFIKPRRKPVEQVVEKVELFRQPAHEIAGVHFEYQELGKKQPKNHEKPQKKSSGTFWFTSMEAVEKPLSVFQQPVRAIRQVFFFNR